MSRPGARCVLAEETSLADVVARIDGEGRALAAGRVFVNGRRAADPSAVLSPGTLVEVHAERAGEAAIEILATRGGLVFVAKPPGIATEPDHAGIEASLVARVERELGAPRGELHALSRLDVGVSGVVTFARDEASRALVEGLRARGGFRRRYVALAGAAPEPPSGEWSAPIGRAERGRRGAFARDSRPATTRYTTVARAGAVDARSPVASALLALSPVTGRTHQLRVHAASAAAPLVGDSSYGGPRRILSAGGAVHAIERPMLHALFVELELAAGPFRVEAAPPRDMLASWALLGGDAGAFELAGAVPFEPD